MSQKESGRRPQQQVAPPSFPPPNCPRCLSDRTKFCYYNNYTVSQPRYYCKDCRRYWTHGGSLRNIPNGGTTRKRGRIGTTTASSSSTSQVLVPPSMPWGLGGPNNPTRGCDSPSIGLGHGTFRPPITESVLSFNGGGRNSNQSPLRFSPRGEFGGVNAALLGGVSVGFSGGAHAPPAQSNQSSRHLFSVDGYGGFGFPVVQRPPQHHPLLPPNVWTTGQSSTTFSTPNNFGSSGPDPVASANVVGINEWCELNVIDYEVDHPLQSYKEPSP